MTDCGLTEELAKLWRNHQQAVASLAATLKDIDHQPATSVPKISDVADIHELYEEAVQSPEDDIIFFRLTFLELRGRHPLVMKEDFCGTSLICCEWVELSPEHKAVGVDLDKDTLQWGATHNIKKLAPEAAQRVMLINDDVLNVRDPKVDFICALNYSFFVFKTRALMRQYFEAAYASLVDDGIFFAELFGGSETMCVQKDEPREFDSFTYEWEQAAFNPATHDMTCHINFYFPDGSKIAPAFTYDWRFWTPPEIKELMLEAGFRETRLLNVVMNLH